MMECLSFSLSAFRRRGQGRDGQSIVPLSRNDSVASGSAVVSTAVFGVSPKTIAVPGCSPDGVGKMNTGLADETSARVVETTALPNPSESLA
jgi:hypothetical protein